MTRYITILFFFISISISAQKHYVVDLIEKESSRVEHYIQNPNLMLSERAIQRRVLLGIPLDVVDIPIDLSIISDCKNTGAEILSYSKWLNIIFVKATDAQILQIETLGSVKKTSLLETISSSKKETYQPISFSKKSSSSYGESSAFITQINTDYLHSNNYTGSNIHIAVLDAGFPGVNNTEPFKELRDRGGIIGTYNFVDKSIDVYKDDAHGTMVLSTMAVHKPDTYIGSAYNASYWLFTTEDNNSETPNEEFNWINAIEYADSVGIDVVNSSLGYYEYDSPFSSYTNSDMDGKTTYISRAAKIGGDKGIIVVISVGNEGNSSWKYTTAPSDAEKVIAIGAVTSSGSSSSFSSYGPASDGRIKPDISAMGSNVPIYNQHGNLLVGSGTSFSSPIIAGSMACLRQAFPKVSISEIINTMHQSASIYNTPNDRIGYGIANFEEAFSILENHKDIEYDYSIVITPNPVNGYLKIKNITDKNIQYSIYDVSGRLISSSTGNFVQGVDISSLNQGYYLLKIYDSKTNTLPFIKN